MIDIRVTDSGEDDRLTPIARIARRIHQRREFARTHCANYECRAVIPDGAGYCSEQCVWDDQASSTP